MARTNRARLGEAELLALEALRAPHVFRSPAYRDVVGEAVEFFMRTPTHDLPPEGAFRGVGVYAIYYTGDFPPYAAMGSVNKTSLVVPAYIGKAVPEGSRTGRNTEVGNKTVVGRLAEHARSIMAVEAEAARTGIPNLRLADFKSRFVILDDLETDLIPTLESTLIRQYRPLWNNVVAGFGNHNPGVRRSAQSRSEWDVLHAGRPFADRLTGPQPMRETVLAKVELAMKLIASGDTVVPTETAVQEVAREHAVEAAAVEDK